MVKPTGCVILDRHHDKATEVKALCRVHCSGSEGPVAARRKQLHLQRSLGGTVPVRLLVFHAVELGGHVLVSGGIGGANQHCVIGGLH